VHVTSINFLLHKLAFTTEDGSLMHLSYANEHFTKHFHSGALSRRKLNPIKPDTT